AAGLFVTRNYIYLFFQKTDYILEILKSLVCHLLLVSMNNFTLCKDGIKKCSPLVAENFQGKENILFCCTYYISLCFFATSSLFCAGASPLGQWILTPAYKE
ncbi:hypothetical protein ACJX0J_033387, partial [Zea mays]